MMTQRTPRSLPTHKAVMALRPNPIAALALMGGTQGQTKAEANRHPDCLIVESQATTAARSISALSFSIKGRSQALCLTGRGHIVIGKVSRRALSRSVMN